MRLTRYPSALANWGLWTQLVQRGVGRHAARVVLIVILVVVVAVGAAVAVILSGPTEFGALRGRVQKTIEAGLGPGYSVEVGRTSLGLDAVLGPVVIIDDIVIRDPNKSVAANIPSTRLAIELSGLFSAHGLVRVIEVADATLSFSRSDDGRVRLGAPPPEAPPPKTVTLPATGMEVPVPSLGPPADSGGFPDLFAALQILDRGIDPAIEAARRSGFERFAMTNATISVKDSRESEPRQFERSELGVTINQATTDVLINFATSGFSGRWTANAERTVDANTGERSLSATFSQLTLADIFPRLGDPEGAVSSDIPLYGRSMIRLAKSGAVMDASIRLDLGAGNIRFRAQPDSILLDEATIKLHWDVANDMLVVEPSTIYAGQSQGVVQGFVRPEGDPQDRRYAFMLESRGAILAPRDSNENPLQTDKIAVSGIADIPGRLVTVDNAVVTSRAGSVSAAGSIGFEGRTPSLALAASFSPMPAAALKQIWPPFIAGGARRWVLTHVQDGRLASGKLEAAIPAGVLWTGTRVRIPDDALRLDFRMEDVTFTTIGTVPAVTHAIGNGSLAGSTFGLDIESGEVVTPSGKKAQITGGLFAVPDMVPRTPDGRVELQIAGDAGALAEIADADPFRALSRRKIDATGFTGRARANLSATWPLQPAITENDITWRVSVDAEGFGSDKPVEGHSVKDGTVSITVNQDEAQIRGRALIDGVPAVVNMLEPMIGGNSSSDGQRQIRLVLDSAARKRLGMGLDEIIGGTVSASVSAIADGKPGQHYDLDLSGARLMLNSLGWTKGIGVPARLVFDLVPAGANYKVDKLSLTGTGFAMSGSAIVDHDYGIVSANVDRLMLRKGDDISLMLKHDGNGYVITARGKSFDLRGLIAQLRNPGDMKNTAPDLTIDAKIDTVIGNNQENLTGASLLVKAGAGTIRQLELKGSLSGTPFTASYVDDERGSSVNMNSTDAGKFFRFVDFYSRIVGGQIRLSGRSPRSGAAMVGVFDVTNFAVLNEPAMQNVMSPTGDRPSGASVNIDPRRVIFDRMLINFTRRDSLLVIDDALLRGAALGATFAGSIDLSSSRMTFTGTYIPAYAFNNFFGQIPVLGLILGGGSRGGLFGVTFKIDGSLAEPHLTVNALSAITPGIFRKIFEFQQPGQGRYQPPPPGQ